jgi:hypothetical protein
MLGAFEEITSPLTQPKDLSTSKKPDLRQFIQKAVELSADLYRLNIRLEIIGKDYINYEDRKHHLVGALTTSLEDGTRSDELHQYRVTFVRQPGFRKRRIRASDPVEIWLQPNVLVTRQSSHNTASDMQDQAKGQGEEMPASKRVKAGPIHKYEDSMW